MAARNSLSSPRGFARLGSAIGGPGLAERITVTGGK